MRFRVAPITDTQRDMCSKEIGSSVQNMITVHSKFDELTFLFSSFGVGNKII